MDTEKAAQQQEQVLLDHLDAGSKTPPISIHIDLPAAADDYQHQHHQTPIKDSRLPIIESAHGNSFFAAFHIISSKLSFQALMLPFAFSTLGWAWGSVCLSVAFLWQLYTIFLLLLLHESVPGVRNSRFLSLAMEAFGEGVGKLAALFPVMYLSGGSCVMLIINGGTNMQLVFNTICPPHSCHAHPLSPLVCFLLFIIIAILIALFTRTLNSVAAVSLVGAVTAITYCTLFWVLPLFKGRPPSVSYTPSLSQPPEHDHSPVSNFFTVTNSIGIIVLSFRGHSVLLQIQASFLSPFLLQREENLVF